jgi:protein arginine N-methyltransferase 1
MYALEMYGLMSGGPRGEAYARAIRETVRPGMRVLEIGTGFGLFGILAAQCGAERVIAVETSDWIAPGRELARANGVGERIEFIQQASDELRLDDRVDLLLADLRGALPLYRNNIRSIADARDRLLAPGGTMIAQRDFLFAALVSDPEPYRRVVEPWEDGLFGVDLRPMRRFAANAEGSTRVLPERLASAPVDLGSLDYRTITPAPFRTEVELVAGHDATVHGFAVWFDCELIPGVVLTNAPGTGPTVYGQTFFPFERPLSMKEGDRVVLRLTATSVAGENIWRWQTRAGGVAFDQSTLASEPLRSERLVRTAPSFRPSLGPRGALERFVLELVDGERSVGEIQREAAGAFPEMREVEAKVSEILARAAE